MSTLSARRSAKSKPKVEVRKIRAKKARIFPPALDHWYVEPQDCTDALLGVENFEGACLDPCCGQGHVVERLRAAGLEAYGSDLVRRVPVDTPWFLAEHDFLGEQQLLLRPVNIIMNPPYDRARLAEAFIRRALTVATGKIAVFVNDRFLGSESRVNGLFRDHPPSAVYRVVPRPSCPPGEHLLAGGKAEGGLGEFDWLVWDLANPDRREWGWARRRTAG